MQDWANLSTGKRGTVTKSGNFLRVAEMKEETEMEMITTGLHRFKEDPTTSSDC